MAEKRHIKLSWFLIEAKIIYYNYPELSTLPDAEYDKLELEYIALCKGLNKPDTISKAGMTGIDFSRPSVQLAHRKLIDRNFRMIELGD